MAQTKATEQATEQAINFDTFEKYLIKMAQERKSAKAKATSDIKCFTFSNSVYNIERKPSHIFKLVIKEPNTPDKQRTCEGSALNVAMAQELTELMQNGYKPFCKDNATELEIKRIELELKVKQAQATKDKQEQAKILAQAQELYTQAQELEPLAQKHLKAQAQELAKKNA